MGIDKFFLYIDLGIYIIFSGRMVFVVVVDINEKFTKISENKNLTFKEIWPIIDKQFAVIQEFLIQMGDKFWIEEFSGSTNKDIHLKHPYKNGGIMVYINGVIQWEGENDKQITNQDIELISDREVDDIIKVVIMHSNIHKSPNVFNPTEFSYDGDSESLIIDRAFTEDSETIIIDSAFYSGDV